MQRSGEDRSRQWSLYRYVIAENLKERLGSLYRYVIAESLKERLGSLYRYVIAERLKERLGSQVCSLIICRAGRCILFSWASEVVDEPIQMRGAYSRSG